MQFCRPPLGVRHLGLVAIHAGSLAMATLAHLLLLLDLLRVVLAPRGGVRHLDPVALDAGNGAVLPMARRTGLAALAFCCLPMHFSPLGGMGGWLVPHMAVRTERLKVAPAARLAVLARCLGVQTRTPTRWVRHFNPVARGAEARSVAFGTARPIGLRPRAMGTDPTRTMRLGPQSRVAGPTELVLMAGRASPFRRPAMRVSPVPLVRGGPHRGVTLSAGIEGVALLAGRSLRACGGRMSAQPVFRMGHPYLVTTLAGVSRMTLPTVHSAPTEGGAMISFPLRKVGGRLVLAMTPSKTGLLCLSQLPVFGIVVMTGFTLHQVGQVLAVREHHPVERDGLLLVVPPVTALARALINAAADGRGWQSTFIMAKDTSA